MKGYDTMRVIMCGDLSGHHRDFKLKENYQLSEFDIMISGDITAGGNDLFKQYDLHSIHFRKEERIIEVVFMK